MLSAFNLAWLRLSIAFVQHYSFDAQRFAHLDYAHPQRAFWRSQIVAASRGLSGRTK